MNEKLQGKKLNMSQIFLDSGEVVPVTIIACDGDVTADLENKKVIVHGVSKGKGFTGVMKKWGFHGGQATRGQSTKPRSSGAIGSQTPGKVLRGKKMAGRHGNYNVTIKGLKIVRVLPEEKKFMVSGPVPGARNSLITVNVL
jgi:large subunit ribosomal protein L3